MCSGRNTTEETKTALTVSWKIKNLLKIISCGTENVTESIQKPQRTTQNIT